MRRSLKVLLVFYLWVLVLFAFALPQKAYGQQSQLEVSPEYMALPSLPEIESDAKYSQEDQAILLLQKWIEWYSEVEICWMQVKDSWTAERLETDQKIKLLMIENEKIKNQLERQERLTIGFGAGLVTSVVIFGITFFICNK